MLKTSDQRRNDDLDTFEQMVKHGGSFVQALGEACFRADPVNLARLKLAFPEYINEYRAMAGLLPESESVRRAKV